MKDKNYVIISVSEVDDTSEVVAVTKDFKKGEKFILEMNSIIFKVSNILILLTMNKVSLYNKRNS